MKQKKKTRNFDYAFPPDHILIPIREMLSDPSYEGSLALPPDASPVYRAKYEASQLMIQYLHRHKLLQKDLAKKLEVDEARMSQILNGRIASFTLDRLIGYVEILYPKLKIKIEAA